MAEGKSHTGDSPPHNCKGPAPYTGRGKHKKENEQNIFALSCLAPPTHGLEHVAASLVLSLDYVMLLLALSLDDTGNNTKG